MTKSGHKTKLITFIEAEYLFFADFNEDGELNVIHRMCWKDFLGPEISELPSGIKAKKNHLLIIPDYWMGNVVYDFQSRKKPLVESFIERKLKEECPGIEDVDNFYGFSFFQTSDNHSKIHVFYLQDPTAFELYNRFSTLGLSPIRIASPAFMWQHRLAACQEDFSKGGKGLIHLGESDCYLYFFFMGQFLFSRRISLPGNDEPEKLNQLQYEIHQSFYLFSQKTKSAVDTLFVLSEENAALLSGKLDKPLTVLSPETGSRMLPPAPFEGELEIFRPFDSNAFSPDEKFESISYKPLKNELAWRPIQNTGMAVGVILLILLVAETLVLKTFFSTSLWGMAVANTHTWQDPKQVIRNYSEAIDKVTENTIRPSLSHMIADFCTTLPDAAFLKTASFQTDTPKIIIEAEIEAAGPEQFREILGKFLKDLNRRFEMENPLTRKDIRILPEPSNGRSEKMRYGVKFEVDCL